MMPTNDEGLDVEGAVPNVVQHRAEHLEDDDDEQQAVQDCDQL
jgi:hypothetical protein